MNDFKESLKFSGDYITEEELVDVDVNEEKKEIYYEVLREYASMGLMGIGLYNSNKEKLSITEIINEQITKRYEKQLSPEEIIALTEISRELYNYCSRYEGYLRNPVNASVMKLVYSKHDIQKENAAKVIAAVLKDMEYAKITNIIGKKYEIMFRHIINILKGGTPEVYTYLQGQEKNSLGEK